MLPKIYRLNLAKEFFQVKKNNFPIHQPFYTALIRKNQLGRKRFGFVVSSKVGKAHERNKARRVLSEAVKEYLTKMPLGFDIVFIANSKIKQAKYEEVSRSFNQVLSKILKP